MENQKKSKKNFIISILSIVFGLIALFGLIITFINIDHIIEVLKYNVPLKHNSSYSYILGFLIGYELISIISSILSLILGIYGNKKNTNIFAICGIVLSILVIISCFFVSAIIINSVV